MASIALLLPHACKPCSISLDAPDGAGMTYAAAVCNIIYDKSIYHQGGDGKRCSNAGLAVQQLTDHLGERHAAMGTSYSTS